MTKEIIIIADYTENAVLTRDEICEIFGIEESQLGDFIAYDIIVPVENESHELLFDMVQLKRMRKAMRLLRDLELNLAGASLVMQLLQELEELRAQQELLNKHILK